MAALFSSDGETAIKRNLDINQLSPTLKEDIDKVYDIVQTINWIKQHNFQNPVIQFPNERKNDCLRVEQALRKGIGKEIAICDDLSRGNCCVEEVQTQKMGGDCIIHYGQACLSPTKILPVLYVFNKSPIDVDHCAQEFRKIFTHLETQVLILYTVEYLHALDKLKVQLKDYQHVIFSRLELKKTSTLTDISQLLDHLTSIKSGNDVQCIKMQGRCFEFAKTHNLCHYKIFFIGCDGLPLRNFVLCFNKWDFYQYDPYTQNCSKVDLETNKLLKRRYYMVERLRDARNIGIVATTPLAADYADECDRLYHILKMAGKRPLVIILGDVSPAKIANFPDKDAFVLVGCPENICHFLNNRDFHKPLVTSFEVELACNSAREWTGDYVTDFRQLLPGSINYIPLETRKEFKDVDISLIDGHVRRLENLNLLDQKSSTEVMKRDDTLTISNIYSSGDFLAQRSWQGLEQHLGQTPVMKAVEGQSGIATGYKNEKESKENI